MINISKGWKEAIFVWESFLSNTSDTSTWNILLKFTVLTCENSNSFLHPLCRKTTHRGGLDETAPAVLDIFNGDL